MSALRSVCAVLVAAAVALTGCTADNDPAPSSPAAAPSPAPDSDFTVDCPTWESSGSSSDKRLPDLQLECLGAGGLPVAMSGTPQRPVLVNIWASWCGPCREEMPLLNKIAALGADELDLLGIASLDSRTAATAAAIDFAMVFPSVIDSQGEVVASLGVPGIPVTLLLDADGDVVYRNVKPYTSIEQIKDDVSEHLGITL